MDEQQTKRRGPMTWLAGSRKSRWTIGLLIGLPVLYLMSSGPMLNVACQTVMSVAIEPGGPGTPDVAMQEIDVAEWWGVIYGPLLWFSEDSWGDRLFFEYWSVFAEPGAAYRWKVYPAEDVP